MRTLIPKNVLQALSNLASKKDIRYYLMGIYVIGTLDKVRFVATDGHIMGLYQNEDYLPDEVFNVIIPNDVIAKLEKNRDHELSCVDGKWQIDNMLFTPIDAKFPDYQRVLPRTELSGEVAQFNPDFIVRFAKAGKALLGSKVSIPVISHNGTSSALVDIGHANFIGIMMPIKTEAVLKKVPLVFLDGVEQKQE